MPIAVAARSLRPIACWNYGFESRREHGCLSLVSVVCVVRYRSLRRVDHRSKLVLRNLVCLCDLGTSKVRRLSSHEEEEEEEKEKKPIKVACNFISCLIWLEICRSY